MCVFSGKHNKDAQIIKAKQKWLEGREENQKTSGGQRIAPSAQRRRPAWQIRVVWEIEKRQPKHRVCVMDDSEQFLVCWISLFFGLFVCLIEEPAKAFPLWWLVFTRPLFPPVRERRRTPMMKEALCSSWEAVFLYSILIISALCPSNGLTRKLAPQQDVLFPVCCRMNKSSFLLLSIILIVCLRAQQKSLCCCCCCFARAMQLISPFDTF